MWHTPDGLRVLRKAEWAVIREGITHLWAFLEDTPRDGNKPFESGIGPFDELPDHSRIALLAMVAEALRRRSVQPPRLTSVVEATIAAVLETIRDSLEDEVRFPDFRNLWRRLVAAACQQTHHDARFSEIERWEWEDWERAVEHLHDRLLWDTDYALADLALDADPDRMRPLRQDLAIDDDYFTVIAPDPTPDECEQARRTLREILGPDQVAASDPEDDILF